MATRYLTEDDIRDILFEDSGSEGFISDDFDTDEHVEDIIGKFIYLFCLLFAICLFHYVCNLAVMYAAYLCLPNYYQNCKYY